MYDTGVKDSLETDKEQIVISIRNASKILQAEFLS